MQRATDVRESCLTKKSAATQVNFLRKVSLTLNPRDQQVSMCEVNTSWPIRFGLWRRVGNRSSIWRSIHRNQCETEPKAERAFPKGRPALLYFIPI